jgi:hypothetical protein
MNYTAPLVGQVWVRNNEMGQKFPGRAPQTAAVPMVRSLLDFFRLPPEAWQKDYTVLAQRDQDLVRIQLSVKRGAPAGQPNHIVVEVNSTTFDPMRLDIVFAEQSALTFVFTDWKSLGPPSVISSEPPPHESTPAASRPGLPTGK